MSSKHRFSRRGFLGAAAGTAAAAAVGVSAGEAYAEDRSGHGHGGRPVRAAAGDLALVNGRVHTFDEDDRVVDSVLVRDGKVVALGRDVDLGARGVRVVDLRRRTVIPGLIGNHEHFIRIGQAAGHDVRRLEAAFSIEAAQQVISAKALQVPEGEFVTCLAGIARRQFAEPARFPTLAELDDAAPEHPVVISEMTAGQTNSLGRNRLRGLGVTVNDDGSVPSQAAAYAALAAFITNETRKRELLDAADYVLSLGLTTVHDQHGSTGGAGGPTA